MNTTFILMAQYETAIVPLDLVARDYFQHLSPEKLWRKYNEGAIDLPIVSIDPTSNKSAKGVALTDLARFLDARMDAARQELKALRG